MPLRTGKTAINLMGILANKPISAAQAKHLYFVFPWSGILTIACGNPPVLADKFPCVRLYTIILG